MKTAQLIREIQSINQINLQIKQVNSKSKITIQLSIKFVLFFQQVFYDTWSSGFNYYIKGEWKQAQRVFIKTLAMISEHEDSPSKTLLQLINSSKGRAPENWKGFGELQKKMIQIINTQSTFI